MQNVTISEASPSSFQGGATTSDIESGNGSQGGSPQEVNQSNSYNTILVIGSAIVGGGSGASIGYSLTTGLRLIINESDFVYYNLLYIPCIALSALALGSLTNCLLKQQERQRANYRAEDRNARNDGMSSVPDQVGLLSPDAQAYVTGVELVHATIRPSALAEGGGLFPDGTTGAVTDTLAHRGEIQRPATTEESQVANNPAVVLGARVNFSKGEQVSDLLLDSNKSVFTVDDLINAGIITADNPAGASQDNTTTAVSVPALTRMFSNPTLDTKQNTEENKPLVLRNDPDSVRFKVEAIERQQGAGDGSEVKSNSR